MGDYRGRIQFPPVTLLNPSRIRPPENPAYYRSTRDRAAAAFKRITVPRGNCMLTRHPIPVSGRFRGPGFGGHGGLMVKWIFSAATGVSIVCFPDRIRKPAGTPCLRALDAEG